MSKRLVHDRVLQIEHISIDRLVPAPTNARAHGAAQIRKIADSMREFGITTPILRDGNDMVVAGHGRLAAMKLLGIAMVPTILLSDLSEAQRRAYAIADNRLTELSSFDIKQLRLEVEFLLDSDLSVELTTFDTVEIDRMLGRDQAAADGQLAALEGAAIKCASVLPEHQFDADMWNTSLIDLVSGKT